MTRICRLLCLLALSACCAAPAPGQQAGELRLVMRAEPKTLNPLLANEENSETIRYLTGGVLIRVNRQTQAFQPELALSWRVSEKGRRIRFKLRPGVKFSDGSPFTAADVAYTMQSLMDPALRSPSADAFRSAEGEVKTEIHKPDDISVIFPAPVAGWEKAFDQVAILSSRAAQKESAVLGPFMLAEHKPGAFILLKRNAYYWKRDSAGRQLPYLDSIRFDIQASRETEVLRFRRDEIHLINNLDADNFERLSRDMPGAAVNLGVSFDLEQMWFNQVASAPIPAHRKEWFRSRNFRRAISEAINRDDLCRIVYGGRAIPGVGFISPANQFWFNRQLKAHPHDPKSALRRLQQEGFVLKGERLADRAGHPVEFSLMTNAGNRARERMAALIQADLARIGIKLNIVTLDFNSIIERMTRTYDYEMCLLGLVNVDIEPMAQMNVWLSSSENHIWNPRQVAPETQWEAEIDRLMRLQGSTSDLKKRKQAVDRVQQIVWDEVPFIYLIHRHALAAVSPRLKNVVPVVLRPQTYWNAEYIYFAPPQPEKRP